LDFGFKEIEIEQKLCRIKKKKQKIIQKKPKIKKKII